MNWFLYLGGGIVWCFMPVLIMGAITKKGFSLSGIPLLGWMMIWIWICWKFIG